MSQASSGFNQTAQQPHRTAQNPLGAAYVPTEDEKRVFKECNSESFWYRSLPFSAIAMAVAQVLVTRGVLSPSPRFGSLPKVAIAGMFGYMGGKLSYMKVCQEKFKKLENSPLGEALRQGHLRHLSPESNQSEFADPNSTVSQQSGFETANQPTAETSSQPNPYNSYSSDYPYSSPTPSYDPPPYNTGLSEPPPFVTKDEAPRYQEEDPPKRKAILYEELRSKNRENYEVTLTQKAETLLKPQAEVAAPKNDGKKNKYGDAWEE